MEKRPVDTSLAWNMRISAIRTTQQLIGVKEEELRVLRSERNALILDALSDETSYRNIQKITGLSRSAIVKIQSGGASE